MALYRMELRRFGGVLKVFETDNKQDAKIQAIKWHETTMDAVIVLSVDGKEVSLKDTGKALGFNRGEFDSLSRYSIRPLPKDCIKKHSNAISGGRVGKR